MNKISFMGFPFANFGLILGAKLGGVLFKYSSLVSPDR